MSSVQIVFAVLGLLTTIAIAPLIKKYFFDSRLRLRAEVRISPAKSSQLVSKIVADYLRNTLSYEEDHTAERSALLSYASIKSHTSLRLRNVSKKKLTNVSVMVADLHAVYQIDNDQELLEVKTGKPLLIGDIAPAHERIVHFWSLWDYSSSHFGASMKTRFRMSADELDATSIRFPLPMYLKTRIMGLFFRYLSIVGWGMFAVIMLTKALWK
ncbi:MULTISPECIES: hypothetical protein [unclassified Mesorhizobium]|uniref:hypothetical protein n=1 Tax=unclassified Mesorhizobium TaxID=325217 RepID=UPI001CD026A9|nr:MULTISPECIES: hypothetical protein [unclassified Mesorhizobium]MBZ9739689.1 hypothetical protein [Mesorhizobium sp. CO1-1-4]MBZ9805047.1 hypothetical protein [Mesorhizobium sp. ES1-6]